MIRELSSSRRVTPVSSRVVAPAPAVARVPRPRSPILRLQQTIGNRAVARLVRSGRLTANTGNRKPQRVSQVRPGKAAVAIEESAESPTPSAAKAGEVKALRPAANEAPSKGRGRGTTAGVETVEAGPRRKSPASAQEDPGHQALVRGLKAKAAEEKTPLETPGKKQTETVAAANLTEEENDKQSGYRNHLETLQAVPGLTVDQFMSQFAAAADNVGAALPQNKDDNDSDEAQEKLNAAGQAAKQQVGNQAKAQPERLRNEIQKPAAGYKDERGPAAAPQKLEKDPAGAAPQMKATAAAAPKPKPREEISLDDKSRSLDDALANHSVRGQVINIEEGSLALPVSGEPSFDEAGATKRKAQQEIKNATPRYRAQERNVIGKSQAEIQSTVDKGLAFHHDSRSRSFGEVLGKQNAHKASLEENKRKVFLEIEGIYTRTTKNVEAELAQVKDLDNVVDGILKEAQDYFNRKARQQLEYIYTPGMFDYSDWKGEHEKEIQEEYQKLKRSRDGGDSYFGIDPAYQEALKNVRDRSAEHYFGVLRSIFISDVKHGVEEKIAKPVVDALNAAKKHIQDGKADVATAFAKLGPREREESKNVLDAVTNRFDQLEESIDDRQREIIGDLARSYNQSLGKLHATFDEIKKDVLTSWWEKAWNKLKAVVNAIIEFASRIAALLGRLAYLVGDIIASPRAFFSNLVSGIGQGFSKFIGGIGTYLATAFFDWLRGSTGVAVRMPSSLDARGIFNLFLQLLNLGIETVWQRMEVVYGKTVAGAFRRGEVLLEKGLEIFRTLRQEGLAGLWAEIRNSLGSILEETLDSIKENVVYAAIKKVILEIGKLIVPGGGFIAIAEKFIRLLQFIVDARDKILDLVEAFVDSVEMAVKGNVGGIADHIVNALTKFITIALDFLVSLFGLGGLKNKVTGLIERMRTPVIRGIDWVLGKFKPLVMKGKKLLERGKQKAIGAGKALVQIGVPKDPRERLKLAGRASVAAAKRLSGRLTKSLLNPLLAGIKVRYGLTALEPFQKGKTWWVRASINPYDEFMLGEAVEEEEAAEDDFDAREFTEESLWLEFEEKGERLAGEGTRLSDDSFRRNLNLLTGLVDNFEKGLPYSSQREASKRAALGRIGSYLEAARQARDETIIYARVRDAAGVVNRLYAAQIAAVPARKLQAHHLPGVKERAATLPKTRAMRLRAAMAKRIRTRSPQNLKAEEKAIAYRKTRTGREILRPKRQRRELIRVYIQGILEKEIEEAGLAPLEEIAIDILTTSAHLGNVHARVRGKDPNERLELAVRACLAEAKKLGGRIPEKDLHSLLYPIKVRYGLKTLEPYRRGNTWWVRATINPSRDVAMGEAEAPSAGPKMPEGLSREKKKKWTRCLELHEVYDRTKKEIGSLGSAIRALRSRYSALTLQEKRDLCAKVHQQLELVNRLINERREYIDDGCDEFDWYRRGTTEAQRRRAHEDEVDHVKAQQGNLLGLLHSLQKEGVC